MQMFRDNRVVNCGFIVIRIRYVMLYVNNQTDCEALRVDFVDYLDAKKQMFRYCSTTE